MTAFDVYYDTRAGYHPGQLYLDRKEPSDRTSPTLLLVAPWGRVEIAQDEAVMMWQHMQLLLGIQIGMPPGVSRIH